MVLADGPLDFFQDNLGAALLKDDPKPSSPVEQKLTSVPSSIDICLPKDLLKVFTGFRSP